MSDQFMREAELHAQIIKLQAAAQGPSGFETWQDAAIHFRVEVNRLNAMIETAYVEKPVYNSLAKRLQEAEREVTRLQVLLVVNVDKVASLSVQNEALRKVIAEHLMLLHTMRGCVAPQHTVAWQPEHCSCGLAALVSFDAAIAAEKHNG